MRGKRPSRRLHRGTRVAPETNPDAGGSRVNVGLTLSVQMTMIASELNRLRHYQGTDKDLAKNWQNIYDDVSDLHYAAFYGDHVSVKRIVKVSDKLTGSVNVDVPTTDGPKLLKEPKSVKGEVYEKENYVGFFLGTTPLMMAAQQGCLSVVKILVDHARADVNACDSVGMTALSLACAFNHENVARYLLTKHAQRNVLENKHGMSPLILASVNNHTDLCKFLVNHHANSYIADRFGRQAIHYAAWNYNWKLVEFLYRHDNNTLNALDINRNTPLHLLVSDEMLEAEEAGELGSVIDGRYFAGVFRQLAQFDGTTADIKRESRRGTKRTGEELECLKQMIEFGANVNIRNNKGQTPLHALCERLTPVVYSQGYLLIEDFNLTQTILIMLKILLESGCVADDADFHQKTPLALSVERKNWLAAKMLDTHTTIRPEVTGDQFTSLADTVATYGWDHLFEHSQVEKDIQYMFSALLLPQKNCKRTKMAERIMRS